MSPAIMTHAQPAAQLAVDGISHSYAGRRVLSNVSFVVPAGGRTALIGENGSGKSTLLRIIAGLQAPDAGTVLATVPGGHPPRIGLLHQEPRFLANGTIQDAVEAAVSPLRAAAAAVAETAALMGQATADPATGSAYADALAAAEHVGAWGIDARVAQMLAGLGLDAIARDTPTGTLSGGQQARLGLARLLLSAPEILLLDEPTNHLDAAATEYLCRVLAAWPGPVLIASHDRAFLNEATTSLLDLDPAPLPRSIAGPLVGEGNGTARGITRFGGNYLAYLHARMDARERWEQQYRDEQAQLKQLRQAVQDNHTVGHEDWQPKSESRVSAKFYSDRNAKVVSRRVNDARSRLETLEKDQIQRPPRHLRFRGLVDAGLVDAGLADAGQADAGQAGGGQDPVPAAPAGEPAILALRVAVAGRLAPTSLSIHAGEKYLLTGPNGSGKTTLLRLLAGTLELSSGHIVVDPTLRVGLLAQEIELPDPHGRGPGRTAGQVYRDLVGPELAANVPLGAFGLLAARDEVRPLSQLSVGQQRRLALAVVLADPPGILLLDEPTNHLSLVLLAQLESAIPHYPGVVIVASHDRWLGKT